MAISEADFTGDFLGAILSEEVSTQTHQDSLIDVGDPSNGPFIFFFGQPHVPGALLHADIEILGVHRRLRFLVFLVGSRSK